MTLRGALEQGARKLAGQRSPRLEAEILLAHVLSTPRSFFYANPELELPDGRATAYRAALRRRARGEPIAYITGQREFWSLTLNVTPAVLIPRPETELLVECALAVLDGGVPARVADLGTGSGAVALAIASERSECEVHATDVQAEAIEVAQHNARNLGLERVRFHVGSWLEPLEGVFDVIVSNPPYVRAGDPHLDEGDCRFEPGIALTDGGDGLAAIREIVQQAPARLAPGGWLMLEHGHDQGDAVRQLFAGGAWSAVETRPDLAGLERVTMGQRPVG
ncbi:MAG: peptide chain release factor N(5)-glutamine methyltransferase [Xanthomonadales bacterium]|nr:peptide chain release factor N(5)-glutamine methyltransferase [Xanthomonadales bacterium]